jgi:hypothetical protein
MRSFLDYFALWTAINMTGWFTLWWTYDRNVTYMDELLLLQQTSIGAAAITLAVWGVTRASRSGSAVNKKYAKKAEQMLDSAIQVSDEDEKKEQP